MAKKIIAFIFVTFIYSVGFSQKTFEQKLAQLYKYSVPLIKSDELEKKIVSGEKIIILDTRSAQEYEVSHLPDARFINYDSFSPQSVFDLDKKAEVITYCTVGYRSERIAEKLTQLGFTDVKNLYGGIIQWANDGKSIVNQNNIKTDSVHTYEKNWSQWLTKGVKIYE